ncbi:MAG: ATP-dependent helicase Lhr and Lhr-like helicase [Chloroflexota bacterium]|jgi:ATP-dependent Lhr-like helicase|nr:ATP-dependent helicase Lhr and Lhr-like helicase [Chloroflexota bacterium]
MPTVLDLFSPPARAWFSGAFPVPTEVQVGGWRSVAAGQHTLMSAPTGSGKTLAAFFWCIDRLANEPVPAEAERCRVLYVSPLKALTVDIERNLQAPLRGIALEAERLGLNQSPVTVAIRTGDTPPRDRRLIERHPPDILITTPESLFLLLTSAARQILPSVRWVIVDEIHSMAETKRGAHLALSLERLAALTKNEPQRIGLSATQRPLSETARFLGGTDREVSIIDAGRVKKLEITVEVPVDDMADLERGAPTLTLPRERGREFESGAAAAIGAEQEGLRRSIWPAIHPRILELVRQHRSTIIFVNSRRLAERLAAAINELAGEELVRAHHGSIAKEQRLLIEDALKAGRLPGLVATSSLELGIDMGAVDLVIQVEAPTSVASGIQRIGRAGHSVGEPSKGTVFPKYRGDLLETAVVVDRMLRGEIETTRVPRNPLDVLAQQIVAMTAMEEWSVSALSELVHRAYPFSDLGPRALESTLDMLSGRYPSDEFAELRPRIVWDRLEGTIRGRAGAQRLAVVSGGTIPDRGLFSVNLLDDGKKVGELDEEMVYEMRPGEVFILGATSWRVADITPSQVMVTPAPGEPGRIAFWHGDALGRPVEVGRAMGQAMRELTAMEPDAAIARLKERSRFDDRAASNLMNYLSDQAQATGTVPTDRTIVIERFRDQLGDWRLSVLTPFGARVHAPWALAARARMQERLDLEIQMIYTDDGFALRLPEADRAPDIDDLLLDPEEVRELVTSQLHGSALFASRFRENAARALLLPRRRPGERTPLWQQRQRSHDLLQVASKHAEFPILMETYRECLSDVFDMDGLRDLMSAIRARQVRTVVVDTERASPFASTLVFDYIGQYMYDGDAPLAERRAQALTLDKELLAELLGTEELRELLDPRAIEALELELQGLLKERWPRDPDEAADLLRRLGDLTAAEAEARGIREEWLNQLERERRAIRVRIADEERWIAAEDAGRYREALGVTLPVGLPDVFLQPVEAPLSSLLVRWARTHVPFFSADPAARWRLPLRAVEDALRQLAGRGDIVAGEFRPGKAGREYCHPDVLRSLRRKSLAALRREVEPVPVETLGRFLPAWHGVGIQASGLDSLAEIVFQLQGCAIPASVLERDVLAARMRDYRSQLLDELISMGEVVWAGRGSLGSSDGRVALYLRSDAPRLIRDTDERPNGEIHERLREHLQSRGASFFRDLYYATGSGDEDAVLDALWDMVWAGEVTNDTFLPLRMLGPRARRNPRRPVMRLGPPAAAGRWSLVSDLLHPSVSTTEHLHAMAGSFLQRYGVLTREAALGENITGGFAALYPVLRAMEEAGKIRRGYFIDGLGGLQFALPGAVDRLRGARDDESKVVALAATDPASPYGTTIPWPEHESRMARAAGAYVVIDGGELRLYLERGGRSLLTVGDVQPAHMQALAGVAARVDKLEIQSIDGAPIKGSPLEGMLREAGFGTTPKGVVLWPERRPVLA